MPSEPDRPAVHAHAQSAEIDFAAAWAVADRVPGWLTEAQARELWDVAGRVPADGTIVEIGSHRGRSTVVLARRAALQGARVVAIDPFVEGVLFGGAATRAAFERTVADAGVSAVVELVPRRSGDVRPSWDRPLAIIYVDGKHDFWTTSDDLRWAARLPDGAPLLMHDTFSSVGVTAAVLARVLPGRSLRYVRRAGSLAVFERGVPTTADRARILRELPWFLRNVLIKIALRALRVVGRRLPDPY